MSKYNMEPIVCPVCKTEHKIKIWESLEASENEKQKEKILDNTFFMFDCKKCDYTAPLAYNFLYSDKKKNMMIWLIPEATEEVLAKMEEANTGKDNMICRVVETPNELKEKIMINDAGMDDRIVELFKLVYVSQLVAITGDESIAEEGITEMLFDINEDQYAFVVFFEKRDPVMIPANYEVYIKLYTDFIEIVEENEKKGFEKIDFLWAKDMFNRKNAQ